MNDLNLNQYKIFYTTALHENISKASEVLFISQPAISKSIINLEKSMNTILFIRNSRGVSLTDEGKILFEHLKSAFKEIEFAEKKIMHRKSLDIGHIKIGASTTLCKYILIPYLNSFIETYPHIKISIECQSSAHILRYLEENKIDIALTVKSEIHDNKNIDFYCTSFIEDIFVSSEKYLNNLNIRINTQNLSFFDIIENANLIMMDEKNMTRKHIEKYFNESHINVKNTIEVNNMDLLIEFAKIGLGVSCVIKEFVLTDLENNLLNQISLPNPIPKREVGFSFIKNNYISDSMCKFIDFYKQYK
jgi:DNA-binding transcriptional LysR family regulator